MISQLSQTPAPASLPPDPLQPTAQSKSKKAKKT